MTRPAGVTPASGGGGGEIDSGGMGELSWWCGGGWRFGVDF